MTVIKINAITVDPDSGDELAHRFAARAGAVDDQDGFEGFELLKPVDDRNTWLVLTRWRDEESFQAWMGSTAFGAGHRGESTGAGESTGSTGSTEGAQGAQGARAPVARSAELWSYVVAGGSPGAARG